jgi:AraC-like DNA-binding protein
MSSFAATLIRPEVATSVRARTATAWSWVAEPSTTRLPIHVVRLDEVSVAPDEYWQITHGAGVQLIYVTAGTVKLEQHGQFLFIESGSCAIVHQGVITSPTQKASRFTALTVHGIMADHLMKGWLPVIALQNSEVVDRALTFMRRTFQQQATEVKKNVAERLSVQAYRLLLHLSVHEYDVAEDSPNNSTVAAAMGLLQCCQARDLDVRRIAIAVGVSVSHLHRLFKRFLNTTPLHYAHQQIITRAREALAVSNKSCCDIAKQLGYDDPLYFSAVFKRYAGESPSTYRRRMQSA